MATITALVGDTSSIGASWVNNFPSAAALSVNHARRSPQLATARIRHVQNPHVVSDAIGGWISADFTIQADEAQMWRPVLRYGSVVWLFDGATPIFYGVAEQPVWTASGECQMVVSGPWVILGRARMREAWDLWDFSMFTKGIGANENKAGQATVNSDGTLTLSFPNGTVVGNNDRVSVDYLLFGEAAGSYDGKLLTAFEFDISDAVGLSAVKRFRVIGRDSPGGTTADVLFDTASTGASTRQGALNLHATNQGATTWPQTAGYRCLRFQFTFTTGSTIAADNYVTLDRLRVSTRENLFQPVSGGVVAPLDTAAIARDVVAVNQFSGQLAMDTPQEFWPSQTATGSPDSNSLTYAWGLDPTVGTGTAPDSGIGTSGFTALEWQSPADIIAALAAIDGYHVGFYLPYNGRGGYDPPGASDPTGGPGTPDVGSFWLTAPPQLYYQPFPDPNYNPDYTIHTQEGAQVEPAVDAQPLVDRLYVNYQTLKGRQLSEVVTDGYDGFNVTGTANYASAQGFGRADDYTIQPSVGDATLAASLAQQQLVQRRQPVATATITIENDGSSRHPILKQGAAIARLATVRPGSVHIADMRASTGLTAGYATHIEWWGQSDAGPEHLELTLSQPGTVTREAAHGKLAHRTLRTRHRLL